MHYDGKGELLVVQQCRDIFPEKIHRVFEKVKGFDCPPLFTKDDFIYRYDKTEESKGDEWNSTTNIIEWFVCVEKNAEIRKEYLRTYDYFAG